MKKPSIQQAATGVWYLDINNHIVLASKLYGTIYENVVMLQGSHWQGDTGFDFNIDIVDSIPGNGQQDLPANGRYNYPLEKDRIKADYHERKDNKYFDATPQDGEITICLDPIKQLYYGHLNIRFLLDEESLLIKSFFGIQIP